MSDPAVTAVLVAYSGPEQMLAQAIASLQAQTLAPAEIICVDQSPDGRFLAGLEAAPGLKTLAIPENLGYSSACNRAAQLASGDYLLFINPDAHADRTCLESLTEALEADPGAAIAGAQILLPDRQAVNAGDNGLHLSGISWAGRYGLEPEHGPPRPAAVVSGAALLVRRAAFNQLGGYTEGFFMYYDDVDLAWRARLAGWEVLFCPEAVVVHDYEFSKGDYKWQYLERNRWWCLLTCMKASTLIALLPLLAAVEVAIWIKARREGWASAKAAAWRTLWQDRRALRARRAELQSSRVIGDHAILERMSAEVDSPFLATPAVKRLRPLLIAYRQAVLAGAGR